MDQLVALWVHSTSCFRWPSLRSSPSAILCAPGIGPRSSPVPHLHKWSAKSVRLFADKCVLYRNIHSLQDFLILHGDLNSLGQWEADWQLKLNVEWLSISITNKFSSTFHYTTNFWKMFSRQNTLVSPSLITWIGVSMSQKFLPKQLRHLVSFAGTCLLHLGLQRKLHTKLWFSLN